VQLQSSQRPTAFGEQSSPQLRNQALDMAVLRQSFQVFVRYLSAKQVMSQAESQPHDSFPIDPRSDTTYPLPILLEMDQFRNVGNQLQSCPTFFRSVGAENQQQVPRIQTGYLAIAERNTRRAAPQLLRIQFE
jgi:hypothetical protein